jgi:hypothetical protein
MNMKNAGLKKVLNQLAQLRVPLFIFTVMVLYIFVTWRVNVLSNAEPTDAQISSKISETKSPRIDQATVNKIRQLQDNSVSVQTLFNEARQNPFQE